MRVPRPGALSTLTVPLASVTRPLIPRRPRPAASRGFADPGSNPDPSSSMVSTVRTFFFVYFGLLLLSRRLGLGLFDRRARLDMVQTVSGIGGADTLRRVLAGVERTTPPPQVRTASAPGPFGLW